MRQETLDRLHDAHQGLTTTHQRARHTVYWPKLQDDNIEMIQTCDECQIHGTGNPDLQNVKSRQHFQHALVTVDYFSGFVSYDTLNSETTEAATKVLNENVRKFELPEKIISDNGPCLKSSSF